MKNIIAVVLGAVILSLFAVATSRAAIIETASGVQTVEVVRVEKDSVVVKMDKGEIGIPKTEIINIDVPKTPAYDAAVKLLSDRKYKEAAAALKPVADQYGGLDVDWVQDCQLKLADAYTGAEDFVSAKKGLDTFKAMYPQSPRLVELSAKYTRIMVGQKKYKEAREQLEKFVEPLLKKVSITESEESATSQALVLLGDCQKALNDSQAALDSYLSVVSLFDVDSSLTAEAKFKAAQLFEEFKKWDRAKGSYKELASTQYAAEAKQRLAALEQAHP